MSTKTDEETPLPPIRHLVLSGGGICGFIFYGALRESHRMGAWDIRNIESIHGCSIGSVFAVIISLKSFFTWEEIDSYLIKRPWHQLFTFDLQTMIQSIHTCGLFHMKYIEQFYAPLFHAVDISLNITMRELYEKTGIDIHIIVTRLTGNASIGKFEMIDVSHTTHPDWKVIEAVYCSSALPLVFSPHIIDGDYYIDGGFMCNYPINQCIERCGNPDEIFGLSNSVVEKDESLAKESAEPVHLVKTLFDFLLMLINSMWYKITMKPSKVNAQFNCTMDAFDMGNMYRTATSEEYRMELVNIGSTQIHSVKPIQQRMTLNRLTEDE
jgi:predicted acylesterase/phospholipase RssA